MPGVLVFFGLQIPRFAADFLRAVALCMILLVFAASVAAIASWFLLRALDWLVPPSMIGIGDEIAAYEKQQKLREYVVWGIVIAAVIGLIVNFLSAKWF